MNTRVQHPWGVASHEVSSRAVSEMPPSEVVRGPCAVAAAGCLGCHPSKNSEHAEGDGHGKFLNWKWTRVSKAGTLKRGDKRFGAAESVWEVGDESWACGACKSLATAPPVRGAKAAKQAAAELAGLHAGARVPRAAAPAAAQPPRSEAYLKNKKIAEDICARGVIVGPLGPRLHLEYVDEIVGSDLHEGHPRLRVRGSFRMHYYSADGESDDDDDDEYYFDATLWLDLKPVATCLMEREERGLEDDTSDSLEWEEGDADANLAYLIDKHFDSLRQAVRVKAAAQMAAARETSRAEAGNRAATRARIAEWQGAALRAAVPPGCGSGGSAAAGSAAAGGSPSGKRRATTEAATPSASPSASSARKRRATKQFP
jgi:hypothetical protein